MTDEKKSDAPNLVEPLDDDEATDGPGLCVPMFSNGRGIQPSV